MLSIPRRALITLLFIVLLFSLGTAGYMLLEGWEAADAFYMTVISISTVGFGEVAPLSDKGRLFTIALILLGVGTVTYGFGTLVEYVINARMGIQVRRRRVMRTINKYHNHIIVCGYGRVGQSTVQTLRESKRQIVIIEQSEEIASPLLNEGVMVIIGDATRDEALLQAGIERAAGLIVTTGEDSINLFIVLSARTLNGNLYIVTRSVEAENERKMRRAGANRVVSPYQIGGRHMANIVIRPHVTDFFDVVTLDGGLEIWVEELIISPDSLLIGKTVGEANIRKETGVSVIALLRSSEKGAFIPRASTVFQEGDELIVLGTREQLLSLEKMTGTIAIPYT